MVIGACASGGVYDELQNYCGQVVDLPDGSRTSCVVSFNEALVDKTDNLITSLDGNLGVLYGYHPDLLVDSLFDLSKLKGAEPSGGEGMLDFLRRQNDDEI